MYSKRDGTGGPFEPGPLKVSSTGRVTEAMTHLGPRALQILADIAERLAQGAEQYRNDLDDGRDWVQETFEELADGLVYASVKLLEVREAKAADEARNRAARRLSDEDLQRAGQMASSGLQERYHRRRPAGHSRPTEFGPIDGDVVPGSFEELERARRRQEDAMKRHVFSVAGSRTVRERPDQGTTADTSGWGCQKKHGKPHDYGQNREPLGPDFYKHYGPPTERDGVWAECSSKPAWPLNTPGEDWEKTRAGCG